LLRFEIGKGTMDNSKEYSIDVNAEEELPIT